MSLLRYPVDAGPGTEVSSAAADALHAHVEREHPSGYYPLGANTTWHGGVHLHAAAGAQVVACAPGRVVAARLAAEGCAYGSTNFVLCRHEVHGAVLDELAPARSFEPRPYAFFSLVMHLGSLPLDDPAAPALRPFAWLPRPWSGFRVKSDLNFRAGPGQDVIGVLKPGDRVVLEQEAPVPGGSLPHYRVRGLPDCQSAACRDAVGTVAFKDEWLERIEVDQDALAELRGGGVVALDAEVAAGDPLWTVGEYGGSEQREGLIHWEIFSAENLLPGWESAEDPDLDFNMDCAQIAALVDQRALVGRDNLDPGEIRDFYARDPDARRMRTLAAKFVSEWGVDVDAAVPRMKGLPALRNFFLGDLADKIRPLMWWDEASAAGVELPADKRVWHYHPVSFLSALEPVWSLEGQSIIIAGQRFPIGAPVKTWLDEGGFDGYTERRVFSEGVVASHPCNEHCHRARRYDTRAAFAGKEEVSYQDVADHVDLFVIHYDACWFSQLCFKVLHDERGLSCHFLLDVDGTLYQTVDLKEYTRHAGDMANERCVGIEIAHAGALEKDREVDWWGSDERGPFLKMGSRLEHVATPGYEVRPARPEVFRGTVNGQEWWQYDYTEEQYQTLVKLLATLNRVLPKIRLEVPRDEQGAVRQERLPWGELTAWTGVLGHMQISPTKKDPGPAFDWDRVMNGAKALSE